MDIIREGNQEALRIPGITEVPWHTSAEADTYRRLRSTPQGLSPVQAEERLREFGSNILPGKRPPTVLQVMLHQFKSPLIYILLVAALVAIAMGDTKDALFIFTVLLLNASIGAVQEWRAEQSAQALQNLLKIRSRVRREGETQTIPAEDLVPGDVVLIESGDKVPADVRLLQATNLAIDEAFLTGESLPAQKRTEVLPEDTTVADRSNMAFAGATVLTRRGLGLVVATGVRTEVGRIARSIAEVESARPPLLVRMDRFSHQIGIGVLVFSVLLGALLTTRGVPVQEVFLVMIAMAVSAIPEGLPVAMTVALSLATSRMARRKVIARRLVAVESLGSCTLIASDKTGTLTVNQQTVKSIVLSEGLRVTVGGQGYNDEGRPGREDGEPLDGALRVRLTSLAKSGALCNEGTLVKKNGAWRHSGDSMDVALLALARKMDIDPEAERTAAAILGEIPFESDRRYAATAYRGGETLRVVMKGAVEAVAPFCSRMQTASGKLPLDADRILRQAAEMAENGYRVLAIAEGPLGENAAVDPLDPLHLRDLTHLGLIGFMDPLRPQAKDAVAQARRAGVKVVMITGDHPATAFAIARELGIAHSADQVLTGTEVDVCNLYDTPEFHERLKAVRVFARVAPAQKLCIVDHLMEVGEFVAVTGDGVNDAPALNRANIGVAMGSGTEVAKDAAQIIVTDDDFSSIVSGIEEGRYAYANVRKVTLFLIATGFAQLVLIGATVLLGMPVPFLAA